MKLYFTLLKMRITLFKKRDKNKLQSIIAESVVDFATRLIEETAEEYNRKYSNDRFDRAEAYKFKTIFLRLLKHHVKEERN